MYLCCMTLQDRVWISMVRNYGGLKEDLTTTASVFKNGEDHGERIVTEMETLWNKTRDPIALLFFVNIVSVLNRRVCIKT